MNGADRMWLRAVEWVGVPYVYEGSTYDPSDPEARAIFREWLDENWRLL